MRWLLSVGALVALSAGVWASDHYISTEFTSLVLMSIVFGVMITLAVAWGVSAAVTRFCRQKAEEKAGALSWSPGPAGRIGLLTVAAGASWLMYWALDHAPWAGMAVFGALAVLGAGWGLVKLAENIRDWRRRVRREREILEAIALRQPIRLSAVRIELDSLRWGADHRRRQRFKGAAFTIVACAGWAAVKVVLLVSFDSLLKGGFSLAAFEDWKLVFLPQIAALPVCAIATIVAVTNWPRRDPNLRQRESSPPASSGL